MASSRLPDEIVAVARRAPLLEHLVEVTARKPELVAALDLSRSTIDRAIRTLENEQLVERTREGYTTTLAGHLATARYRQFVAEQESILGASELIECLPEEDPVPVSLLTDARIITDRPASELFERLGELLPSAHRCRALLPALPDTRLLRLCHAETVRGDLATELLVSESVIDRLETEFPRLSADLVGHENVEVRQATTSIGVLILESVGSTDTGTVLLAIFEDGEIQGMLEPANDTAIRWAREQYETRYGVATDCTDRLRSCSISNSLSHITSDRLPHQLRDEGFHRVDQTYLERCEPLSPTASWRAGLGLPEVAAGHAVARPGVAGQTQSGQHTKDAVAAEHPTSTQPLEDTEQPTPGCVDPSRERRPPDEQCLADQVLTRLRESSDCAVVGPAGSGKSTVLKRVAVKWTEREHGNVLYRGAGSGQPIESVALLEDVLERTPNPMLVVVEDAVRSETTAIFEVMNRLDQREDVVFLLDARESEWREPPPATDARLEAYRREAVEAIAMPRIDVSECRELLAQAEQIVDEEIAISADTLLEDVREAASGPDDSQPGTMLLLFDRLARMLEPVAIGNPTRPTRLDEVVDRSRASLADIGEPALEIGLLCHLLNAAEIRIAPAYLYAPAIARNDGSPPTTERLATIRAALDHLDRTVLVHSPDRSDRTVHRRWSVRYLERAFEVDEVGTRRRLDHCVTAMLSLADNADRRALLASLIGSDDVITVIEDAPCEWADETAISLLELLQRNAQLGKELATPETDWFGLPDACSPELSLSRLETSAVCQRKAGALERAKAAFERLEVVSREEHVSAANQFRIEGVLGQADVARRRSSYDDARDLLETALELASEMANRRLEARCRFQLGLLARSIEAFDEAQTRFQQCRETFQELGATKREADALRRLGEVRAMQAELSYGTPELLETAIDDLEASLARYRSIGDRQGRADSRRWLGQVRAVHPDEEPRAARQEHRIVVALARQMGDRDREAKALYALGDAWFATDELLRAREQFESALELFIDCDRTAWTVIVRRRLGILAVLNGTFDRAREHLQTALDDVKSIDRPEMATRVSRASAMCALYAHDLDAALEHASASLERAETLGDGTRIVRACQCLGRAQILAGDLDGAAETANHLRAAARAHDVDGVPMSLYAPIASLRGEDAAAREHARRGLDGPEPEGRYPIVLGRVALARGALEDAIEYFTDAIEQEYGDEHRYWRQHALIDRARARRHAGKFEQADADLQTALDHVAEYPYPLATARITLERGALARATGSLDRATTLLDNAQDRCSELGSPLLLSRVQYERALLKCSRHDLATAQSLLVSAADRLRTCGAHREEARVLAALLQVSSRRNEECEQVRSRYEEIDCEHRAVSLFDSEALDRVHAS